MTHETACRIEDQLRLRLRVLCLVQHQGDENAGPRSSHVYRFARGAERISEERLERLADSLAVPLDVFLDDEWETAGDCRAA